MAPLVRTFFPVPVRRRRRHTGARPLLTSCAVQTVVYSLPPPTIRPVQVFVHQSPVMPFCWVATTQQPHADSSDGRAGTPAPRAGLYTLEESDDLAGGLLSCSGVKLDQDLVATAVPQPSNPMALRLFFHSSV